MEHHIVSCWVGVSIDCSAGKNDPTLDDYLNTNPILEQKKANRI